VNYSAGRALLSTSAMSGIESATWIEACLQRFLLVSLNPRALPQATADVAPLALADIHDTGDSSD